MTAKHKLGEQIQAVRAGARVLSGAEKPPAGARERGYLAECAESAVVTLEWMRDNEAGMRKGKAALALLRKWLPELPDAMRAEVVALLGSEAERA